MYVLGTAGHVDHGKSTLVKALTGIDPDRLVEEQRREMTIDLGFAWLQLPSGRSVSVIDVPGHERFIKNMLAGVGGLDAAMLIIAADEAVMPQTVEHMAILDLLEVRHGVVVLTKADMVDDEWLALVGEEVATRLAGSSLAAAPLVPVSARTGSGLAALRSALDQILDDTPSRSGAHGAPRLPIDRAFTIDGFGTVVTGTLIDGPLSVGDELLLLPGSLPARVRGLQTHKQREERALPGSRVAVNLAGVHHSQVARGDVLARPGALTPTTMLDMRLRVLSDAPQPIVQNMLLDLFVGAAEIRCRITLLDAEALEPGASGWVQLRLERPLVAMRGDRCILRLPSPSQTIGGGRIVDTSPLRHRRFRPEVVATLAALAQGDPADLLLHPLADGQPRLWDELIRAARLPAPLAREGLARLLATRQVLALGAEGQDEASVLISVAGFEKLAAKLAPALRAYHGRFPLRRGMPREELRQRLRLEPRALRALLDAFASRGLLRHDETSAALPEHHPQPDERARRDLDNLLAAMRRAPYSPPTPELDPELLAWALERELLVKVAEEIYFLPDTYTTLLIWVRETISSAGGVTVGQFRDRFGSSRKYALAFLEHLDERKITRRVGEGRVLV